MSRTLTLDASFASRRRRTSLSREGKGEGDENFYVAPIELG
jgi:hypothetical protein